MIKHLPSAILEFEKLKEKYGFPLYAYDEQHIKHQYKTIKDAFNDANLSIHFACKANSNIQILRLLLDMGSEVDVVSLNEGKVAELAGFKNEQIHFTPNGVLIGEYLEAIERGYQISVDNLDIIQTLAARHTGIGLCVRINPSVMAGGHSKISVGHSKSKFGLPLNQLDSVVKLNKEGKIKVHGLHIHTGSDIKDVEAMKKASSVLIQNAQGFLTHLKFLDFGGGFKVPYRKNESAADISEIGLWIQNEIKKFHALHGTQLSIVLEPGKFIVSEAGYFLAEVSQVKNVYGKKFIYVNAGFNHFMRPMYYDAYHYISNLSKPDEPLEEVDVVGYLCENDHFAKERKLPQTEVGDVLCFHNAGAYSYTMSSSYNMRERPAEVLFNGENVKIIQKRQVFEDLIRGQIY